MSKKEQEKHTQEEEEEEEEGCCNVVETRDYMSELPRDLLITILTAATKNSLKTVVRYRCVCKAWCDLLQAPDFATSHFSNVASAFNCILLDTGTCFLEFQDHQEGESFSLGFDSTIFSLKYGFFNNGDDTQTQLLGSCNGLLCFSDKSKSRLFVSNPLTMEYVALPKSSPEQSSIYGFGFSPKTNKYKVLQLFTQHHSPNIWRAKIHILGTQDRWRNIGIVPYTFSELDTTPDDDSPNSTYLDGTLYWVVNSPISSKDWICSFDLESEQFQLQASLPELCQQHDHNSDGVFRGRICIVCEDSSINLSPNADIWVLNKDNSHHNEYFWSKEVVIIDKIRALRGGLYSSKLMKLTENWIVLFIYSPRLLILHNPRDGSYRSLRVRAQDMVAHVPSFISLKHVASGENWKVINAPLQLKAKAKKEEIWWETFEF